MDKFENKCKILDNVNQWIFNCDTKVSIILATLCVFLTLLLSSDISKGIINIIKQSISNITVCNVVYILALIIGLILLLLGIYKLIRVLLPTINLEYDSVMFFGKVAEFNNFNDYLNKINSFNENDMNDDVLHQILAASKICNQKFKNQKYGLILSMLGLVIVLGWTLIGFIVYYI